MTQAESSRMLFIVAENMMRYAIGSEQCPCNDFDKDSKEAQLIAKLAIEAYSCSDAHMIVHLMLYCYRAGKKVAQEETLKSMMGEELK